MTNPLGVDWVATGPSPAQLAAAGKVFALRYLDRPDYPLLTRAEIDGLHAANIDVGLIAEWGSQRMLGGASAGVIDGMRARAALTTLGAPAGTVVYFAADWPATSGQMAAIDAYLQAVSPIIGQANTGIYGGRPVIAHCIASKSASHFWQTYAWSGTPPRWVIPGIHLQQYLNGQKIAGKTVDLCAAIQPEWGQWHAGLPDSSTGAGMKIDSSVIQWWTASEKDGVLRTEPNRALAPAVRVPAGEPIVSFGEWLDPLTGNNWRFGGYPIGSRTTYFWLRSGPGIPADHDFIAGPFGTLVPNPPPAPAPSQTVTVTGQNITVVGP